MKRILRIIVKEFLVISYYISPKFYMKRYPKYLKWIGVDIADDMGFIHPSVEFDSSCNYSLIHIGDNVTISKNVLFLTHDYSINRGLEMLTKVNGGGQWAKKRFLKDINIGRNCFIGARVCLLPGTSVGDNSIVGTGAVLKGKYEANSIIVGNPAKTVGKIDEWTRKHIERMDFVDG